ncbi:dephospho-CoA kinase [Ruegeria arenilitoris]|uniref:dephospho-CoA kinase n=1 Tax=Ruegeria arenilitoris TaxID=1173585 RepID=UPI00147C7D41|nr:dephospho-CoA kinase [Ruegeria arenilitoris]
MSFALGLTGSIGMGKSTTAKMFADEGCALWDADDAVHRLYSPGGTAVQSISEIYPEAIIDGSVNRNVLKQIISKEPSALKVIESIVHPLVSKDRATFRASETADIIVFDIPLLFETGGDADMDAVACVSISPEEQKRRVMTRGTMTEAQFDQIRSKQMPNEEKCRRSDFVIVTDTLDHARAQVQDIVRQIRVGMRNA